MPEQHCVWPTLTYICAPEETRGKFSGHPFKMQKQNASTTEEYNSPTNWLIKGARQALPQNKPLPCKLRAAVPQLLGVPQRDRSFLGHLKMRCWNVNKSPQASLIVNEEEQVPQRIICITLKQASKAGQMDCSLEIPISYCWLKREPRVTSSNLGI